MERADIRVSSLSRRSHFHKGRRRHWMICRADNGEGLVSWGHEAMRELAEAAAEKEVHVLSAGTRHGGAVTSATKTVYASYRPDAQIASRK